MNTIYVFLLGLSALTISGVGATFSVTGLAKLFAGAPVAVMFMAGSLEFAKLVAAGFLHRSWSKMPFLLKCYLTTAVVLLVGITSMGIFGYLTHAYQATSENLKRAELNIASLAAEDRKVQDELRRLQAAVDAVPTTRIARRIELQRELEPQFQNLRRQSNDLTMRTRDLNLQRLSYQTEIGPILYVAQAFGKDNDTVSRWLILLFVIVFDPLAVCLVLTTSFAITFRQQEMLEEEKRRAAEKAALASNKGVTRHKPAGEAAAANVKVVPQATVVASEAQVTPVAVASDGSAESQSEASSEAKAPVFVAVKSESGDEPGDQSGAENRNVFRRFQDNLRTRQSK